MSKVIDLKPKDDLGHESAENRILMIALAHLVHIFKHPKFENIDEDFDNTGMGKDFWGKYSWAIVEHNGKEFEVQLREKITLDKTRKYYQQQYIKEKNKWQIIN